MYSFDLLMNDSKVVGEWSDYIQGMYVYRDKVYYITGVDLDNGLTGYGAMTYDMKEKTTAPLWDQAEPCYTIHFDGSYAWYTPMESGSLRRYNLDTGEDPAAVEAKISAIEKQDRITLDPAFPPETGGNRYANWLRNMLLKGADLYEVYKGEKAIGFFVIQRKDEYTVDPVLMAMYDEQNDRGLGVLLHKKTLDTCFTYDCKRLTSTFVSNNSKVLRIYVSVGATISDTLYTYVKHL